MENAVLVERDILFRSEVEFGSFGGDTLWWCSIGPPFARHFHIRGRGRGRRGRGRGGAGHDNDIALAGARVHLREPQMGRQLLGVGTRSYKVFSLASQCSMGRSNVGTSMTSLSNTSLQRGHSAYSAIMGTCPRILPFAVNSLLKKIQ